MKISFRYRLDRKIRALVMGAMKWITPRSSEQQVDFSHHAIKKILLVRSIFRMGDSILATPAILLFRKNFPDARIDFVGPEISEILFQNLPIYHHYEAYQDFPRVCWSYLSLIKQLRSVNYDLAVDVSGSSAAMGAFIVGFSAARIRVGVKGKWDRWFNVRFPRPAEKNKYRNLPALVGSMGLETQEIFPSLILTPAEMDEGTRRVDALVRRDSGRIVGIFVGGRITRKKRWPKENFVELANALLAEGRRVIIFVGPEEKELLGYFQEALKQPIPVVFEPDLRRFVAMIAGCDLFVACDSGPVHLACAIRVKTIAIFLQHNFDRWGPPPSLARIVYRETTASPNDVLEACRLELNDASAGATNVLVGAADSPYESPSEIDESGFSGPRAFKRSA